MLADAIVNDSTVGLLRLFIDVSHDVFCPSRQQTSEAHYPTFILKEDVCDVAGSLIPRDSVHLAISRQTNRTVLSDSHSAFERS